MIALDINGRVHTLDVDPDTPLLWVLREWAGLTGTKYGCGVAQCGAKPENECRWHRTLQHALDEEDVDRAHWRRCGIV